MSVVELIRPIAPTKIPRIPDSAPATGATSGMKAPMTPNMHETIDMAEVALGGVLFM
jgi:hypothetical protein